MAQNPFDTIESAHEYLRMLDGMLEEVQATTPDEFEVVEKVNADDSARREEALRLVIFKLDQLRHHVAAGSRILNDLRTLRRLLLGERCVSKPHPFRSPHQYDSSPSQALSSATEDAEAAGPS
jgi:hypothetical protein